jgi:hypothetical protein
MATRARSLLAFSGTMPRANSLAHEVALAAASNQQAAKLASEMEATKLAQAIMGLIKKGIKPSVPVVEAAITSLSQSNNKSAVIQKVLDILANSLKGPPVNKATCPPDSIGDAYFAGRKTGCVFGTPTNPIFKLKSNQTNQTSWKGWKLVPGSTSGSRPRFDFVKEEYTGGNNNVPISTLATKYLNKNLADSILAIIKGQVHPKTVNTILTKVPQSDVSNAIIGTVKAALAGVNKTTLHTIVNTAGKNNVNPAVTAASAAATAGHTPATIHAVVQNSSTSNLVNKLVALITVPVNTTTPLKKAEGRTGLGGFFSKLFKGRPSFPVLGTFVLNPINLIPQFINGIPVQWTKAKGYFIVVGGKIVRVFQRGNELVSQLGQSARNLEVSGAIKEKIAGLVTRIKNLAKAAKDTADAYLKALREAQNASNANRAAKQEAARKARLEMLEAQRKVVEALAELMKLYKSSFSLNGTQTNINTNSNSVFSELYSNRFAKMSATARSKRLAELLKKHTPGSKARNIVKTRTLEEIRNAGQNKNASVAQRRLENLRTNIKPALSMRYNQNLMKALGVEGGRALANLKAINNYEGRRNERPRERGRGRGYDNYGRRSGGGRYNNNYYGNRSRGNEGARRRRRPEGGAPPEGPSSEYSNAAAAALPMNQKNAITNAGGVRPALNTVANVPGGATEVAKAAEALNETNGNVSQAVNVKGVSPAAIQAVQKLGGPKNAVIVLHGLNTLSQKTSTIRRKAAAARTGRGKRRTAKPRIRVAELNRVINSVKKQKLISLVAHNVTKTHNIHPNDEKKKKYYKKVIKANIMRTKFAKIVKKASKK